MAAFNKFLFVAICFVALNKKVASQTVSWDFETTPIYSEDPSTDVVIQSTLSPVTVAPSTVGPTGPTSTLGLDRQCGCTKNKIWLDIVAVIDTSKSITQEGLSQVQANLDTIVHELTLSAQVGYSSRISIVTFASNATVVAGLDVFNSPDDFENSIFSITVNQTDSKVNILAGLQAANSILGASSAMPNRRRVVILYTSAYDNGGFQSPIPLAQQMREDNVKLITVAFAQSMGSSDVDKVGELAWPTFAFTNNQTDLIDKMYDALCQANCFCYSNWRQYTANYSDPYAHGYGVCLYYSSITAGWTPVSHTCRNEKPGAYLATESTKAKHDFNLAYSMSISVNKKYSYHIGLSNKNGQYSWQQSTQSVTVPLNASLYSNWNPGYPNAQIGDCVKVDKVFGNNYGWTNENCWSALNYICEVNT